MEQLQAVVPTAARVAFLANPDNPATGPRQANFQAAAQLLGQQVLPLPAREPDELPGWDSPGSPESREHGDRWLAERRSAVLIVPAVTARPIGRNFLINPDHPDAGRIRVGEPFLVPWDDRIF